MGKLTMLMVGALERDCNSQKGIKNKTSQTLADARAILAMEFNRGAGCSPRTFPSSPIKKSMALSDSQVAGFWWGGCSPSAYWMADAKPLSKDSCCDIPHTQTSNA